MSTLYTYCLRVDDGAAPNPFWEVCTLVICKPRIRSVAREGDWIVGTGSANSKLGDMRNYVIYAMQVTKKMTMREYDLFTQEHLPEKIPNWYDRDLRRRLGDSMYDFSYNLPKVRTGVHNVENRATDLGGKNALLSEHFFYFGDRPRLLPKHLLGMIKHGQGHRSKSNGVYVAPFLDWLFGLGLRPNRIYGNPQDQLFEKGVNAVGLCNPCSKEDYFKLRISSCSPSVRT